MKIKKLHIWLLLLFGIFGSFLLLKMNLGELTPDEIFYTSNKAINFNISYKFLITKKIFVFIYSLNEFLLPIINILLVSYLFVNFYNGKYLIENTVKLKIIVLIFFLPSVIYFASAYLRDIYIYLLGLYLLFFINKDHSKIKILIVFSIFTLLRYEAGVLLIIAYSFSRLIVHKDRVLIKVRKEYIPIIIILFLTILFFCVNVDAIWAPFSKILHNYENQKPDYGILQLPITQDNVFKYSLVNWVAFYVPFMFKPIIKLFDYYLLLESVIIGILFFRAFIKFNSWGWSYDLKYRVSLLVILGTFFIALPESSPETIFRHRMAYLPFLIYLNFPLRNISK